MAINKAAQKLVPVQGSAPPGHVRSAVVEISWSAGAKYTTGGESLTAKKLGFTRILVALPHVTHGDEAEESELFIGAANYKVETEGKGKLQLINLKTGAELANEKKIAKVVVTLLVYGY